MNFRNFLLKIFENFFEYFLKILWEFFEQFFEKFPPPEKKSWLSPWRNVLIYASLINSIQSQITSKHMQIWVIHSVEKGHRLDMSNPTRTRLDPTGRVESGNKISKTSGRVGKIQISFGLVWLENSVTTRYFRFRELFLLYSLCLATHTHSFNRCCLVL